MIVREEGVMLKLKLNTEERTLLQDTLEYDLKDLRNEISNTENWQFKEGLKKKEEMLKKVLAVLAKEQKDMAVNLPL